MKSVLVALLVVASILMSGGVTDTAENSAASGANQELTVSRNHR